VLIVGDPSCGDTALVGGELPRKTWTAVVMGKGPETRSSAIARSAGIDPEYHYRQGAGGAAPTNPRRPDDVRWRSISCRTASPTPAESKVRRASTFDNELQRPSKQKKRLS